MKKKSANRPQQLSPDNYIRQRSLNIPIVGCYITSDWETTKMCSILIVRQHANANVTFCYYLVDLSCLGIKNSFYRFNEPFTVVEKLLTDGEERNVYFMETSYKLVHNIIYAGLEYAEKWGFAPCKEFASVTRYFLEPDTVAIPSMKIPCGEGGKPMYVNSGFDSPVREKQILAQLEKTAGEGNYLFMLPSR